MSSSTNDTDEDVVMELADDFIARHQNGESPSIAEYCDEHPELADQIREIFPTLLMLEASKSTAPSSLQAQKIGTYQLLREIGRGGMGIVYEAQHETLERRVAVKVLPKKLAMDRRTLARFHREARAIAKLHHSNIVPLYDVGAEEGQRYFAMQLISGPSLDRALLDAKSSVALEHQSATSQDSRAASRKLDLARRNSELKALTESGSLSGSSTSQRSTMFHWVAKVGSQIADAIDYAHRHGILHRDVKPSNILLDESGTAWLSDFGLAKTGDDELTQTGDFVGTLRYMSPERFRGQCDERADIYGLGLTLYEMLAMQPAFSVTGRLTLIEQISQSNRPRLRDLNPRIPRDLETIVLKACDPIPKTRYRSASEFADDLRSFLGDRPIKARRVSATEHVLRWSRRNRGLAAAIVVSALSLVLLTVVSGFSAIRQSELRLEAEAATRTAESRGEELQRRSDELQAKTEELQANSEELQRNLYFAQMNLASAAATRPSGAETIKARLDSTRPDAIGQELRGWEWHYLSSLVNQESALIEESGWTWEVSYSPDGNRLACAINGLGVAVYAVQSNGKPELVQTLRTNGAHDVLWSPDGNSIASTDYVGNVIIWDAETYVEELRLLGDEHTGVTDISWNHDSSQLASTVPRRKKITIWDAETGEKLREIATKDECNCLAFHPVANVLAARFGKVETLVYDTDSGKVVSEIEMQENDYVGNVCWSPDGLRLLTTGPVRVWDWKNEELILEGPDIEQPPVAWRPGYQHVAFPSDDGIKVWDLESKQTIRDFYGQPRIQSLSWSADGQQLSSSGFDRTIRIWNIEGSAPLRETLGDGHNDDLDWDGRGRFLIGNSSKNFTNVWDTTTFELKERLFSDRDDLEPNRLWAIAVNKSDGRLAFGGSNEYVRVWDRETDEIRVCEGIVGETKSLAWSPDGRLAAICWPPHYNPATKTAGQKFVNNLVVWDQDGKLIAEPKAIHNGFGKGLDWHPDGSCIATAATDSVLCVWDSFSLDLKLEIPMPSTFFERSELRYSPDGTRIATANQNALYVWDSKSGSLLGKLDEIQEDFMSVDWTPDGAMLAAGTDSSTSVWDAERNRLAIRFDLGANQVRWASDGLRLGTSFGEELRVLDASRGYALEGTTPPGQLAPTVELAPQPPSISKPTKVERSELAEVLMSDEWQWSPPIRLPESVNTEHNEYEPFVTEDGLELLFNSDRPGGLGGFDLYVCRRESIDDEWGPAENLGEAVNSTANDEGAHLSADGKSLTFNSYRDGDSQLFVSTLGESGQWTAPRALAAPVNSDGVDGEPTLSRDGLTLMFVSTRTGNFELYVSQRASLDELWLPPENPKGLNTSGWQGAPCIIGDETGSVVIFHSADGPKIASRKSATDSFLISESLRDVSVLGGVTSPFLSADGRTLFYRRLDPTTGTYDLWTSQRLPR
ncbi:MAG: protein kinase [Planctomycetota bacterium]